MGWGDGADGAVMKGRERGGGGKRGESRAAATASAEAPPFPPPRSALIQPPPPRLAGSRLQGNDLRRDIPADRRGDGGAVQHVACGGAVGGGGRDVRPTREETSLRERYTAIRQWEAREGRTTGRHPVGSVRVKGWGGNTRAYYPVDPWDPPCIGKEGANSHRAITRCSRSMAAPERHRTIQEGVGRRHRKQSWECLITTVCTLYRWSDFMDFGWRAVLHDRMHAHA